MPASKNTQQSMQKNTQDFSTEEVQQILTIAMGKEAFSRTQLEEMASELSIDDAALSYAIDLWKKEDVQRSQKRQQRQRFYREELLPYVVVNTFLVLLDIAIAGAITWSIYPLLGWGMGLLIGATSDGSKRFGCKHHQRRNRCSAAHEVSG
ncbi:MAG: 2TM domain-containing protein [Phormidesmis sp.]